jgi:hypothetical protein
MGTRAERRLPERRRAEVGGLLAQAVKPLCAGDCVGQRILSVDYDHSGGNVGPSYRRSKIRRGL